MGFGTKPWVRLAGWKNLLWLDQKTANHGLGRFAISPKEDLVPNGLNHDVGAASFLIINFAPFTFSSEQSHTFTHTRLA